MYIYEDKIKTPTCLGRSLQIINIYTNQSSFEIGLITLSIATFLNVNTVFATEVDIVTSSSLS